MDTAMMVESFKYLKYSQLAKNILVSKRFRDVIGTHRHSLALLYVDRIYFDISPIVPDVIKIFDKGLSPEAYNEWITYNNYSKQAPAKDRFAHKKPKSYLLKANAYYTDPNHPEFRNRSTVFFARVLLKNKNWPAFQHFTRLITDQFIYIDYMHFTYQNDVLKLLAGTKISNFDRLLCKKFDFNLNANSQKSLTWIKNYVHCNHFRIYGQSDLNQDEAVLDFVVTGAHSTSSINIGYREFSKGMVNFVQKFVDLKTIDECLLVEAIEGNFKGQVAELLKRNYADFLVKEERRENDDSTEHIFEFVNTDIGKKLQLAAKHAHNMTDFSIKINNL